MPKLRDPSAIAIPTIALTAFVWGLRLSVCSAGNDVAAGVGGANGDNRIDKVMIEALYGNSNTSTIFHDLIGMPAPQPPTRATITYDDGQEHVLAEVAEQVFVNQESELDLRANVLVVAVDNATLVQNDGRIDGVPGAERGVTLRNSANFYMNSGRVNGIEMDASTLVLNGGGIHHWDCDTIVIRNGSNVSLNSGIVGAADPSCRALDVVDSFVQVDGARVIGAKTFGGASTVVVSSGQVDNIDSRNLVATDTTRITITGGSIEAAHDDAIQLADSATLQLSGGIIRSGNVGVHASDDSVVEFWGGKVMTVESGPVVRVSGSSELKIVGGSIEKGVDETDESAHVVAAGDSTVTIRGSNFNFPPFESVQATDGFIAGTLADGTPINWRFERAATATILLLPFLSGDYTLDGVVDVADIDQQAAAMRSSIAETAKYDENDDGRIDSLDRMIWVHDYAATSFGDANLDGVFNSSDLVEVFVSGKYGTGQEAGWAAGDWNGDGVFSSGDLVFAFQDGGYQDATGQDVATVPEPDSCLVTVGFALAISTIRRRARP